MTETPPENSPQQDPYAREGFSTKIPPAEMDPITASSMKIAGVIRENSTRPENQRRLIVNSGIGVVLGPDGKIVKVDFLEDWKKQALGGAGQGYLSQQDVKNYLDGIVGDFGQNPAEVARIGTLGATGALAAALAFLKKSPSSQAGGKPVGWTGYGLGDGKSQIIYPKNSWSALPAIFDAAGYGTNHTHGRFNGSRSKC
ncbi:hypothetical protein HZA38_06105 [Candidatus Peregrinibacteria bacterium]|nr:hypothetical protein [Candidatus Peregrinibacteria bacterium]